MKHLFKNLLSIAVVTALPIHIHPCSSSSSSSTGVVTQIIERPVSLNNARKVAGETGKTHRYNMQSWYANFSVTPGYERNFKDSKIARCLFGDLLTNGYNAGFSSCNNGRFTNNCDTLLVQGSTAANRADNALLADYFYLPTDFSSMITFRPQISNFFIDFNAYLGLDALVSGGYLRFYAPFVHARRDLDMQETIINNGSGGFSPGYFTPMATTRNDLPLNATASLSGAGFSTQGVTGYGLCFSKIRGNAECNMVNSDDSTINGFGDLRAELGWNFWHNENSHLGFNIQGAAPTGTRPKARFLFDAVIGNGKHWELGAGATGNYILWKNGDETKNCSINFDLSVLHLFGTRQQRIFDLADKPLSRFMLAAKFRPANDKDTLAGNNFINLNGLPANFIFDNIFTPIANLTTQDVNVSVCAQIDCAAWFNITAGGFSADLGYDLWYRGCEKFNCSNPGCPPPCCPATFANNTWAIKGDEYIFGYNATTEPPTPVALSASTSNATVTNGAAQNANMTPLNASVDQPQLAFIGINDAGGAQVTNTITRFVPVEVENPDHTITIKEVPEAVEVRVATSIQPTFIGETDLAAAVANATRSRQLSNKAWGHLQYTWNIEGEWAPYAGLGVSGEFGRLGRGKKCTSSNASIPNFASRCTKKCADNCVPCTPSQWAIWAKIGLQF